MKNINVKKKMKKATLTAYLAHSTYFTWIVLCRPPLQLYGIGTIITSLYTRKLKKLIRSIINLYPVLEQINKRICVAETQNRDLKDQFKRKL